MSQVNQVSQQVDAFKNLMLKARDDEKNSIIHFNTLMQKINNINMEHIKDIMPTIKTLVTRYGNMQALNMVAPEAFVRCQQFLDELILSYDERTRAMKADKYQSADPKTRETIDHRDNVIKKLLRKWETYYIVPLMQRAEIKYVSIDASSEATFVETLDSVKTFINETQPEEPSGISKGTVLSNKY